MARPNIQIVQAAASAQVKRKIRSPRHPFFVAQQPYEIKPFFIAPVLPGETMKSLRVQGTCKSGLMREHLTGWWLEHYFFYVKHRDLAERDLITDIHVANTTSEDLTSPGDMPEYYHAGTSNAINWTQKCLVRVVEEYFRNEGETFDEAQSSDGLPLAAVNQDSWLDSAIRDGALAAGGSDFLPDEALEEGLAEANAVPAGFENHYDHWLVMRRNNLIATDFEDYLRANGIKVAEEDVNPHRPELLRYTRNFQTPKRALASTGEEASRLDWSISETADKDRLFKEPGFVFGVQVLRPKSYRDQNGTAVSLLNDAWSWLPALLGDNPETSLRTLSAADAGAMFGAYEGTEDVVVDLRDLYLYGDQFVSAVSNGQNAFNHVITDAVPNATFGRRYVDLAANYGAEFWFATAATTPPETLVLPPKAFVCEGLVSLSIASRIQGDGSGYGNNFNPAVA